MLPLNVTVAATWVHVPEVTFWELVFWTGRCFDLSYPFRDLLDAIASCLGHATVELPQRQTDENYVEGQLRWRHASIDTYFEYELGYLSLQHRDDTVLDAIVAAVTSSVSLVPWKGN